ncbi:MAG: hypothetical protein Q7S40_17605 [Opitutaceae bacterium]|nr:hypothetical protein [Opitutaceae bacterium]
MLRIFSGDRLLIENDNWVDSAEMRAAWTRVGAFNLNAGSLDAALLVTLPPGAYGAQVGANGGDGVTLVEVYELP